jgi:hypothetical protein
VFTLVAAEKASVVESEVRVGRHRCFGITLTSYYTRLGLAAHFF